MLIRREDKDSFPLPLSCFWATHHQKWGKRDKKVFISQRGSVRQNKVIYHYSSYPQGIPLSSILDEQCSKDYLIQDVPVELKVGAKLCAPSWNPIRKGSYTVSCVTYLLHMHSHSLTQQICLLGCFKAHTKFLGDAKMKLAKPLHRHCLQHAHDSLDLHHVASLALRLQVAWAKDPVSD